MIIATTIAEAREQVAAWRAEGLSVGLVPTMGYLHEGHMSLMQRAAQECDRVVASVFVNPTQFGPDEDFDSYPRDLPRDAAICEANGVNMVFHPTVDEMYPQGYATYVQVEKMGEALCGKTRPIHFRGVCTVVSKLFNIIDPDKAFFGQKDAQQLSIIKRLVADMNMRVTIVGCPIVREEDGLAKSSRNTYLSPEERVAALCLSRAVRAGEAAVAAGQRDAGALIAEMKSVIEAEPLARIDYVEAVNCLTMQPVEKVEGEVLVAMAVYIGTTRLIDNFIVEA